MKKFKFSLEKVLSFRIFLEKQAEVALQRATGMRDAVKIKIETIDANIATSSELFSKQDVDITVLLSLENYIKGLKVKKLQLQQELLGLEKEVSTCLVKYREALKNRKVLEKLKEKGVQEWKYMLEKEEILCIDEVVSAKISMHS